MTQYSRLFLLLLLTGSCSGASSNIESASFNLPEEATHELRELFRVNEPVEGVFFTSIKKIHPLDNGHLVVQSDDDHQLYELGLDGTLIQTLGREGRGPGEFRRIESSLMIGDTLHVFDEWNARHSVWIQNGQNRWEQVRENPFDFQSSFTQSVPLLPRKVIPGPNQTHYGLFRIKPSALPTDTVTGHYNYIAPIDHNTDTINRVGQMSELSRLKREADLQVRKEGGLSIGMNARFFHGFYQYDSLRDEVIYITNVSNEIVGIDPAGNEYVKGYLPFDRFPRSEEADRGVFEFAERYNQSQEYVDTRLDLFLDHEPYYWNVMLYEDELWVHLARSDDGPNWVVAMPKGEVLKSFFGPRFFHPNSLNETVISRNRIYGPVQDSTGIVYLAAYELMEIGG